ncbi:MAG TPA: PAS domain S-box protein [Caulobacteraceae bacterium]|jgi:PAS domain S-box-containing protein
MTAAHKGWAARLFFTLVIFLAALPVAGWPLPVAWLAIMAGLIVGEQRGLVPRDSGAGAHTPDKGLFSWLLSAGYSSAALYFVLFYSGAAQTLGVTLYGVIMFEVLVRNHANPRRLLLNLIPPALSIALVQVAAAAALAARREPLLIVTLLASPVTVFWVFRTLQNSLTRNQHRLADAAVRAEAATRQIQEAHRITLLAEDLAGVGHWRLDMQSRAFTWSDGVYRVFGLDRSKVLPNMRSLWMMWAPEDRNRVREAMSLAMLDATPFSIEARLVRADGEVRYVVSNAAAERDEAGAVASLFGAFMDVTETRLRELALSKSEEQFRLLADKSNDVIMQTTIAADGSRRLTYISPAIERVLGYRPSDDPGALTLDYVHPDDVDALVRSNLGQIRDGPNAMPRTNTYRARHRDGRWIWLEGKPSFTFDPVTAAVCGMITVMRDVTTQKLAEEAQKQAEETIRQSEARYRLLAENATDVIMQVDPSGVITFITPACQALLGYSPEEMIGTRALAYSHPDDVREIASIIAAYVADGPEAAPILTQYRVRHRDGRWIWIEGRPKINFDATGAQVSLQDVIRDITKQKLADDAIRSSEERFRLMAENATDTLCSMDLTGAITFVTQACERLLGYTPQEMIGVRVQDLMSPEDAARIVAQYTAYIQAGPGAERIVIQYRSRHKDGHWVWIEGQPTIIFDAKGAPVSIQDVVRDIGARKAVEFELARAREAAEAATAAKSDFLANMSHEIRTPLTAILGFSAMLEGVEVLGDDARLYVQRIVAGGRSLLSVVNDILDFSKLEANQVELDPQPFDPVRFAQGALELVSGQAASKGLKLDLKLDGDLPDLVYADNSRLRQILLNLLSNAIKFTPKGSVTVTASYQPAAGLLRLAVTDTGSGILAENLPRLFERFSQADSSISRRHGGTGLGLAICKNLVELMGGEIQAESVEGEGSTFSFTIAAPPAEAASTGHAAASIASAPATDHSAHILVVDDVAENRELVRLMLQAIGHRVDTAAGGVEAVAAAIAQPFDLILMDIQMPGMDGLTATRLIRETAELNRTTPILALSANVMAGQVAQCFEAGMNDHIAKPIQVADLLAKVACWTDPDEADGEHDAQEASE